MPTRTGVLCLLAMLLLVAAARAQQPASSPSPSAGATPSAGGVSVSTNEQTSNQGAQQPLQMQEVVVEGQRIEPSASAQSIPATEYALKPHNTPIQILNDLPGLIATQHQGGGKAPQYLIRGFDADHGTDFAVFADDTPVNLVSHAHGQGYADINFVIPETIDHLDFSKGPYYAKYGDFDNAGALNIVTKDEFDHPFVHAEGGSWGTQRYVAGASPKLLDNVSTLFAGQAYFSNGPFIAPAHDQRYSFLGKIGFQPTTKSTLLIWLSLYTGRWDGSGQIPLREVSRGLLDRFGSEDPHEGGYTDRESFNLRYVYKPNDRDKWTFQAYATRYKLGLFTDFTFYKDSGLRFITTQDGHIIDTRDGPIVPGANYIPGDGIEQNDARVTYGGNGTYSHSWSLLGHSLQSEFGIQNRNDRIDLGLYRQVQRQRFFIVNRVHLVERSASGWAEQRVFPTDWMEIVGGLRGDIYFFHAGNRLPGQPADPNFQSVSITGGTMASIVSPKASVILTPIEDTSFYFNFGTGFHSNDAREAILTPDASFAPLARSIGWEVGARTRRIKNLELEGAFWFLDLDSELVFNGDAGNQEIAAGGSFQPSAATRRWGIDFHGRYQLTEWIWADYDLNYADPRFRSGGGAIPLAPTLLMDGDLTLASWHGFSGGLRARFLNDRPADEQRTLTAPGYTLIDLIGRYNWRNIELSLQFLNLNNRDWREAQFSDNSCVRDEIGVAPGCLAAPGQQTSHPVDAKSDVHFTPGNPFTVIGGFTWYFD